MARFARSTVTGFPHQVTQRGNYDQTVFETDVDYRRYLAFLAECAARHSLCIWAYCLMPNHVHFVCVPFTDIALARTFNSVHMRYSQYFNKRRGLSGHLWKGRFSSCTLDEPSVFEEVRFIENNPVRRRLVDRAEDYPYSSAPHHVLGSADPVLRDGCFLEDRVPDWRGYLSSPTDEPVVSRIRRSLRTGRPAGGEAFVRAIEEQTGRRLAAMPRGRPRKNGVL